MINNNSDKIILDLCGGSGAWSRPYKEAGYDVRLITLPEFDVTNVTFMDHLIFFKERICENNFFEHIVSANEVYGILAAPPCTEFSRAKTTAPRDFEVGMETVKACMEIIWHCQIFGKLNFWALENPDGLLYKFLGRPVYRFEQWQFGFPLEKPTVLWGMFKNPNPTVVVKPEIDKYVSTNTKCRVNNNSRLYASPTGSEELFAADEKEIRDLIVCVEIVDFDADDNDFTKDDNA
jgi:hypothetical protein